MTLALRRPLPRVLSSKKKGRVKHKYRDWSPAFRAELAEGGRDVGDDRRAPSLDRRRGSGGPVRKRGGQNLEKNPKTRESVSQHAKALSLSLPRRKRGGASSCTTRETCRSPDRQRARERGLRSSSIRERESSLSLWPQSRGRDSRLCGFCRSIAFCVSFAKGHFSPREGESFKTKKARVVLSPRWRFLASPMI